MPSASDLAAGTVVTILFLGIVAAAEIWRRRGNPSPESTRKLIHVAGGLVALSLPFVIRSPWVVLAMALGMAGLFLAGKLTGRLQSLHGVSRRTSGTEYYPLVIYILFVFTQGAPWKYVICVLVLTTADALAALVGSRWGRLRYEVDHNSKSVEGSAVFLVATFLAVLIPLLLWPTPIDPLKQSTPLVTCLLTALLIAVPTTGLEAISQHGRDNLWVPLGALLILNNTLHLPVAELIEWTRVLLAVCAITGLAAWRTARFNVGAMLVLILAAYACWTLTSFDWAVVVFLGYGCYLVAVLARPRPGVISSGVVVSALLIPFVVMLSAALALHYDATTLYRFLYGVFVAGCITVTSRSVRGQVSRRREIGLAAALTESAATTCLVCGVIVVPTAFLLPEVPLAALLWATAAPLAGGVLSETVFSDPVAARSDRWWSTARDVPLLAAMAVISAAQMAGLSPLWHPR